MPVSKAQQKAVNKYMAANYDRINLTVPKGKKETIQSHAEAQGQSVNGFINRAIDHEMERDSAGGPQEAAGAPAGAGGVSVSLTAVRAAQEAAEATEDPLLAFLAQGVSKTVDWDVEGGEHK